MRETTRTPFAAALVAALALIAALAAAPPATADWQEVARIEIPFAFTLEDTSLSAGEYIFTFNSSEPNLLKVDRVDGQAGVITLTTTIDSDDEAPAAPSHPRLVFETVDGRRFLEEAHFPDREFHWQIEKGREYVAALLTDRPRSRETVPPQAGDGSAGS